MGEIADEISGAADPLGGGRQPLGAPDTRPRVRLLDGMVVVRETLTIQALCRDASVRARRGHHPSLASIEEVMRVLAGYYHLDFETGLAAELFKENRIEPFLNRMYPKKAGRGERSRARRVLKLCAAVWTALRPIDVGELPSGFKSRLRTLIILREISPRLLAKEIRVHRNVMGNWVRDGETMPTFGFRTHLREAEIVLDVPEGTLTGLPDVEHIWIPSRRAALANAKQTDTSQALAQLKAFFARRPHGHSLAFKDWPAALQNEWHAILASRAVPLDDSTREEYEYIAGCYFAFLLDSQNVALADLSFALLARIDWCEEYLELERGLTVGKTYNSRADVLGALVGSLLKAKRGWVWRQENFCSLPPFAGQMLPVYELETARQLPVAIRFFCAAHGATC